MKEYSVSIMKSKNGYYTGIWHHIKNCHATSYILALVMADPNISKLKTPIVRRPRKGLSTYEFDNEMYSVKLVS